MAEDDLDDLDDLLDDFDEEILSKPPGATLEPTTKATETQSSQEDTPHVDDFVQQMAKDDPQLSADLQDFLQSLGQEATAGQPTTEVKPKNNFQDAISQTVNRLKTSGESVDKSIENESKDDELLTTLLKSLDLDTDKLGADGKVEDIGTLLEEMLNKLSSKEVLYEPLHDLHAKLGPWLAAPKNKSDPDYAKYEKQYEQVKLIVVRFETAGYSDADSDDKAFINEHLELLQELGMPPKELVNDDLSFLNTKGTADKDLGNLEFGDEDIPPEVNKELEETCQQT